MTLPGLLDPGQARTLWNTDSTKLDNQGQGGQDEDEDENEDVTDRLVAEVVDLAGEHGGLAAHHRHVAGREPLVDHRGRGGQTPGHLHTTSYSSTFLPIIFIFFTENI